jgi:L,D-peptidoglycan transpeptidase YkuD (ErfK/YbiS/YcfS/YnhG family)
MRARRLSGQGINAMTDNPETRVFRVVARPGERVGSVSWPGGGERACSLGRSGVVPAQDKREGDGASPLGKWVLRSVFYRPDREAPPRTGLPLVPLRPQDGWCDDPASALYNRPVSLPFARSFERLWREDGLYDLCVVLGHNDEPPVAGMGSAIFLHLRAPDGGATEGCVALARGDLLELLALARPGDRMAIALQEG